jgi:hypothetical protein
MSKQEDKQQHTVVTTLAGSTVIDVPAGVIALEGADAPNVSPKAVPFSAGKQASTVNVTTAGVRFANPA